MTDAPHPFDAGATLEPLAPNVFRGRTIPEWGNMVGPFGGMTTATLLRAVLVHPERQGDPLALTINFVAPIADSEFDVVVRLVRTNRTNQHWTLELQQGAEVKATASVVLSLRRETWSETEASPPSAPAPEELEYADATGLPVWLDNYDQRFVVGRPEQSGEHPSASSTTTVWFRLTPARSIDYAALAASCDVFIPRVFVRLGRMLPAGTISMTTYFHASAEDLADVGADFVLGTARAATFGGGHFDQSAQLWSRGGALLASSHQIVYFKG
jgi:acyl-CoA thioesterase